MEDNFNKPIVVQLTKVKETYVIYYQTDPFDDPPCLGRNVNIKNAVKISNNVIDVLMKKFRYAKHIPSRITNTLILKESKDGCYTYWSKYVGIITIRKYVPEPDIAEKDLCKIYRPYDLCGMKELTERNLRENRRPRIPKDSKLYYTYRGLYSIYTRFDKYQKFTEIKKNMSLKKVVNMANDFIDFGKKIRRNGTYIMNLPFVFKTITYISQNVGEIRIVCQNPLGDGQNYVVGT